MKRILALFLVLIFAGSALAESPDFQPAPSATETPEGTETPATVSNALTMTIMGVTMTLDYDPDPLYSYVEGGNVLASFFAYDAAGMLYELYLCFPQTVASGDTFTANSAMMSRNMECGVMMYISDSTTEVFAAATQDLIGAYPDGSSYSIHFTSVTDENGYAAYTGTLQATLIAVDEQENPLYPIGISDCSFSFSTTPVQSSSGPESDPTQPDAPEVPYQPSATLPPTGSNGGNFFLMPVPADAQKI